MARAVRLGLSSPISTSATSANAHHGKDIPIDPLAPGEIRSRHGAGRRQGQPMLTVRTAMVSLLPAANSRKGLETPYMAARLVYCRREAPQYGQNWATSPSRPCIRCDMSVQNRHARRKGGDATPRRMTQRTCVPALTDQGAKAAQRQRKPLSRRECSVWASPPRLTERIGEIRA